MKKRRQIDFDALTAMTSGEPVAMHEAVQRVPAAELPQKIVSEESPGKKVAQKPAEILVDLNFKVPVEFRKRFRLRAAEEDINYVELFFRAFEAWEAKYRRKS